MFKVGDKVLEVELLYNADYDQKVGTVRARYRHHYLVSWPDWRKIRHDEAKDLISVESPFLRELKSLAREIAGEFRPRDPERLVGLQKQWKDLLLMAQS